MGFPIPHTENEKARLNNGLFISGTTFSLAPAVLMQQRHTPYLLERLAISILALNIPYINTLLT